MQLNLSPSLRLPSGSPADLPWRPSTCAVPTVACALSGEGGLAWYCICPQVPSSPACAGTMPLPCPWQYACARLREASCLCPCRAAWWPTRLAIQGTLRWVSAEPFAGCASQASSVVQHGRALKVPLGPGIVALRPPPCTQASVGSTAEVQVTVQVT